MRATVAQTVLGNHDAAVSGRMDYSYYYHAARHVLDKHAQMLEPENMAWLKSLPYEFRENDVLFCHGSQVSVEEFDYIFARDQAAQCLAIWERLPQLTLIGHSHLCKAFAINPKHDGAQEVVTLKFQLRASYTLYDSDTKTFEYKRVEYDVKTSASKILASDLRAIDQAAALRIL